MMFARKRATARFAATALASGLFTASAIATAGLAAAEEPTPLNEGVTATLGELETYDEIDVTKSDGETDRYVGGLFNLTADDGGTLQTYCIDFTTRTQDGAQYKETDWDSSTLHDNPDAGKINWILQNSFPTVDAATLAEQVGVDSLTDEQAAAGTQAAIWELSDGVEAVPVNENAATLTDWLTENAGTVEEPQASLSLTPAQVSGQPGEQLGPVTVDTAGESAVVTLDPAAAEQGVTLVTADGTEVTEATPVADGTELFFEVPADAEDGTATLTATVTSQVPVGRAFTGIDTVTQTMILAGSSASSVTAAASASWVAPGQPSVAVTAEQICAEGGVRVTATNNGDVPFTFELNGESKEIAPGASDSILVPVENGQEYDITVANPVEGQEDFHFTGVLDCTTGDGGGEPPTEGNEPQPASTGGNGGGDEGDGEGDLAETGSSSNPAMIAGIAVVLLAAGGAAIFFLRRRSATAGAGSDD
jgi:TQXA domain-containing protein/LPXTG-motif cell wall-anchored protein